MRIYYDSVGKTLNDKFAENLELKLEDDSYNYVAYLLSDENSNSIKVAKYKGTNKVELIERNEYGHCSLIKATKSVLDKLELENKTITEITSKERKEQRLWNPIALREAVINAIIHNDYSNEASPQFEIYDDRLEITSAGGLVSGLSKDEFFDGYSLPRNKELMRVFKDLGMVEQLGSGIPRILEFYPKDGFKFSDNFLRMTFKKSLVEKAIPQVTPQAIPQVTPQVEKLLEVLSGEMSRTELQTAMGLSDKKNFVKSYLTPALEAGVIEMTIPDKPNSQNQRYRVK
ncbi:hypothetical protein K5X82_11550 [Halosquirtibacter xylanolyticus]|uniref:Fic family protein n=1 Tax=Halosquirtibacter xylanolyticus TaxID=3374599 RepID=UPI00374A2919|nr:hypothetical protein K5X82_11550 [Prolixibacteraceae bacterium]